MEIKGSSQSSLMGIPIHKQICFTTGKSKYSEKIVKQQTKILKKFSPFLTMALEPGEEIWLAVKATSPMSLLEQMTIGWVIVYIKRCILIFTNKRILHFPTRANFSPKASLAQIRYGDIKEIKLSGFLGRTLKIEYQNGKKEKFSYLPSREFKKLKTLIPNLAIGVHPSEALSRHHLCPKCVTPLQKNVFSCPNCHLEFKNPKQAIRLSLIFPGGGYFYTGHPLMGIGDAIVETILLVMLVKVFFIAFSMSESFVALTGMIPVALALSVEKLITIYDTKHFIHEYIPVDKSVAAIGRG
ncbi:MAG: PH domain-containing protein [Syntrophaceae bacterium]|nr:PH domain-containing protein [Syntrophaceae bacterium]